MNMQQSQPTRLRMRDTCYAKSKISCCSKKPSKASTGQLTIAKNSETSGNKVTSPTIEKPEELGKSDITKEKPMNPMENTLGEMQKRKREQLLAKRAQAQAEREKFVKEMAEKKAAERAEIIKQARRLILYKKPLCRKINRALLVSECLRELDAQVAFQKTLKEIDKQQELKYVDLVKEDANKYEEDKKRLAEKQLEKVRNYGIELKKQIDENERNIKEKQKEEFEGEKQDQENMNMYLQLIKEHEAEDILQKKKKLQKFFKDAIEEKKHFELELKREDEFEDKAVEVYRNAKARIRKMHKALEAKEKEERERKAQLIVGGHDTAQQLQRELEDKILKKAVREQEEAEKEKEKTRKDRENAMRAAMEEFKIENSAVKAKQQQEEKDCRAWEMMQRFHRDEYDKQVENEGRKRDWNKKLQYANVLRKNIEEKQIEMQREKLLEEKAIDMTAVIEKENKKILDYAEEVVEESRGVRPLYPILKAIEECKKEMGLVPLKQLEYVEPERKPKRKGRIRRCTKTVPEDQICFL